MRVITYNEKVGHNFMNIKEMSINPCIGWLSFVYENNIQLKHYIYVICIVIKRQSNGTYIQETEQ